MPHPSPWQPSGISKQTFDQKLSAATPCLRVESIIQESMSLLSAKQYTTVLMVQYTLLLYDIGVNAFVILAQNQPVDMLVLYIIQDLCLIVALTILLGSFFSTYIFRVGLIQLLYSRFRLTLVLCVTYLVLSITLHSWHVNRRWTSPAQFQTGNKGFHTLYAIHRILAVIYYYFYKRAALRISDPRLYEGSSWVQKQLSLP